MVLFYVYWYYFLSYCIYRWYSYLFKVLYYVILLSLKSYINGCYLNK